MTETKRSRVATDKLPERVVKILMAYEKVKRRGDNQHIAKELGLNSDHVGECLRGQYMNDDVVEMAVKLTDERLSKWAQYLKQIG